MTCRTVAIATIAAIAAVHVLCVPEAVAVPKTIKELVWVVSSVDTNATPNTVTLARPGNKKQTRTCEVNAATKITVNGEPGKIGDIKAGMGANVMLAEAPGFVLAEIGVQDAAHPAAAAVQPKQEKQAGQKAQAAKTAGPAKAQPPAAAKPVAAAWLVVAVDKRSLTKTVTLAKADKKNETRVCEFKASTEVIVNGAPGKIDDIQAGMKADITMTLSMAPRMVLDQIKLYGGQQAVGAGKQKKGK